MRKTERIEVRLPQDIMRLLRDEARGQNVPVAQIVRQAIEAFLNENRQSKLQAAQELFQVGAPVADWEQMKREIEEAHVEVNDPK